MMTIFSGISYVSAYGGFSSADEDSDVTSETIDVLEITLDCSASTKVNKDKGTTMLTITMARVREPYPTFLNLK
jgi:hypothetical protein